MLYALHIKNFILIDELHFYPAKHFSVITGETGAGKSILLSALSLIMGQRTTGTVVGNQGDKCIIEAVFHKLDKEMEEVFNEMDIDYDSEECIIRREINRTGRSRAFINDSPAPLSFLKQISDYLIDIHSQHKNLLLGDLHFRRYLIDIWASNKDILKAYQDCYDSYILTAKELHQLKQKSLEEKKNEDFFRFQLKQLQDAELKKGEEKELENKRVELLEVSELREKQNELIHRLLGEDYSHGLCQDLLSIEKLFFTYPNLLSTANKHILDSLKNLRLNLEDLANNTLQRIEEIESASSEIDHINSLLYKHHLSTSDELLLLEEKLNNKLLEIDSFDNQINILRQEKIKKLDSLYEQATALRKSREKAAQEIELAMQELLPSLELPYARFKIDIQELEKPNRFGKDEISFLFSANQQLQPEAIEEIASGGEIARLMLCLKSLIAGKRALPTIIFDEIDTGVSGKVADRMGQLMQLLASGDMQVMTITHLPQIAARGAHHYFVYKIQNETESHSSIRELNEEERIKEIAKMQSGEEINSLSLKAAKALLMSHQQKNKE